jgi:tRNA nucleotidyltransferase (CCA-adding enzyme)
MTKTPVAERFSHQADIGVRGVGPTREAAFEQAAIALTAAVTDLDKIAPHVAVNIACDAPDDAFLFVDWLNALIYEMAERHMLFNRFDVKVHDHRLSATVWGETVDPARHSPAVEPKGATYTALKVEQQSDGSWLAQTVVDV